MDELPGAPAPSPDSPYPGARRIKRRLMSALIALYAASVIAACVLIARNQTPVASAKSKKDGGGLLGGGGEPSVGWIAIHGPIYNSDSGKPWDKGVEQWVRRLRAMSEDKDVKAIVLDINSPGGSVGAVQELYSQIERVRKEKHIPVVALFDDVAASGGYYIASACDKIVAHPGTLTGSIGVIFDVTNLQGLFKKIGLTMDPIKSGKHKDIGSPARPMTAEERALLQNLIMDAYGQFVAAVSQGRGIPVEKVKPLADGRIFSGHQAIDNHLVDQLGDSEDAILLAGHLAGIPGRPKVKREANNISDLLDMLDSRFEGALPGASANALVERLAPEHFGLEYRWAGWGQ